MQDSFNIAPHGGRDGVESRQQGPSCSDRPRVSAVYLSSVLCDANDNEIECILYRISLSGVFVGIASVGEVPFGCCMVCGTAGEWMQSQVLARRARLIILALTRSRMSAS